jgi:hypothetical protein
MSAGTKMEWPRLDTGVDGVGFAIGQGMFPAFGFRRPGEDAYRAFLIRPAHIACDAGVDIGLGRHDPLPWVVLRRVGYADFGVLANCAALG